MDATAAWVAKAGPGTGRTGELLQDAPAWALPVISSPSFLPQYPQFPFINAAQVLADGEEGGGVFQMKDGLLQNRPEKNSTPESQLRPPAFPSFATTCLATSGEC